MQIHKALTCMALAVFRKPPACLSLSLCQLTAFEEQSFTKWAPRHNLLQGRSSARTRNAVRQNSPLLHSISSSGKAPDSPRPTSRASVSLLLQFPHKAPGWWEAPQGASPALSSSSTRWVFFFLFPSLTLCKVGRVEENPYWGLIKMPQALSEGFLVVCAPCSDALKASPAQTIPSSYPGSSGEILGQSMTSLTYLRAPAENTWATLPHIKRRQETGTGFLQLAGAIHDVGHRPTGHPANPQCTARAQDLAVPACQTPSHHQKAPVTHLLISHARILQRGRRFCNPELVLNSQVEGDEAQVTATMLQGACTTELPAHPPPNSPQGEIRYKTFVTARTDLNL